MEGPPKPGSALWRVKYSKRHIGACSQKRVLIKPIAMVGDEKCCSAPQTACPKKGPRGSSDDSLSLQFVLRIDCTCICGGSKWEMSN